MASYKIAVMSCMLLFLMLQSIDAETSTAKLNATEVIQEHGWKVLTTAIPVGKVFIHFDSMQVTYNMPITQIEMCRASLQCIKKICGLPLKKDTKLSRIGLSEDNFKVC